MKNNLILIGFMGAGKTSVGLAYANARSKRFLDTDQMIEQMAGMSIREIFDIQGEAAFRSMEAEMLKRLLEEAEETVVSTGGGLPLREENQRILKELGRVIYLKVSPETVLNRLKGDTTRPLLAGEDPKGKVCRLLWDRGPIYESAAHMTIDVDEMTVEEIVSEMESLPL